MELSRNLVFQAVMIYRAYGDKSNARQLADEGLEIARKNNLHAHYNQLQKIVKNIFNY